MITDDENWHYTALGSVRTDDGKINLKYIKKLEIIIIIQENLEEQLIAFVI